MTKPRLAYTVQNARRAVNQQRRLLANPERNIGRSERLDVRKTQPSIPQSGGTCSETNPTPSQWPDSYRGIVCPSSAEAAGLGSSGNKRDTLAIVVGGVTTTQGAWESHVQGEGPEASSFDVDNVRRC